MNRAPFKFDSLERLDWRIRSTPHIAGVERGVELLINGRSVYTSRSKVACERRRDEIVAEFERQVAEASK